VATRTGRNQRFQPLPMKRHPSFRDPQQACAVLVRRERVFAAKIHGSARRRVDEKQPGRRRDLCTDFASRQCQSVFALFRGHHTYPAIRLDLDGSDLADFDCGTRRRVRFHPFASPDFAGPANVFRSHHRRTVEPHDVPPRGGSRGDPPIPNAGRHQHHHRREGPAPCTRRFFVGSGFELRFDRRPYLVGCRDG